MKAITTKYFGPTDTKGSRIKAYDCDDNSVTIPYPYELNTDQAHEAAARALVEKMGWGPTGLIGGSVKKGMVWVMVDCKKFPPTISPAR